MQEPDDDADVPTVTLTDVLSGTVRERASDARRPSQQLRHLFKADAQQDELAACARYVRRCLGHPVLPTWPEAAAREALMRAVAKELGVEEAAPLYPHPGDAASLRGALADVEAQLASCRTARRVAADEASGPTEREAALVEERVRAGGPDRHRREALEFLFVSKCVNASRPLDACWRLGPSMPLRPAPWHPWQP